MKIKRQASKKIEIMTERLSEKERQNDQHSEFRDRNNEKKELQSKVIPPLASLPCYR